MAEVSDGAHVAVPPPDCGLREAFQADVSTDASAWYEALVSPGKRPDVRGLTAGVPAAWQHLPCIGAPRGQRQPLERP